MRVRVVGREGAFSVSCRQLFILAEVLHSGAVIVVLPLSFGTLGGLKTFCFFLPGLSWRFFTSVWFMKALLALFSLLLVSYLVLLV